MPDSEPTSCTQIIYLTIPPDKDLSDAGSEAGGTWTKALNLLESFAGFRRAYWGRSPENLSRVQLHVVRNTFRQHQDFLASSYRAELNTLLGQIIDPTAQLLIRHAYITEQTPNCQSLGRGAPFTGTAIYLATDVTWHEGAWPLWTHIVRHVKGCMGVAGGKVVEAVDGYENCYIVYVGWESIEAHEDYHHTKHFERRRVILGLGNQGYREYCHVKFDGSREKSEPNL